MSPILVIYGAADGPNRGISKPGAPRVLLLNAKTLQVTWDRLFPDILSGEWCEESCGSGIEYYNDNMKFVRWPPAVVLSEDRSRLSADGARLYVLGYTTDTRGDNYSGRRPRQTSLGLRIVDVKSGHKFATLDSEARGSRRMTRSCYWTVP